MKDGEKIAKHATKDGGEEAVEEGVNNNGR